jgi:hypothetical protein
MAALQGYIDIPSTSLTGGTGLTVLNIVAPTNQRIKVLAYGFYFDGTSNSATPVQAIIARPTSAGTYTSILPVPIEQECTEVFQGLYNYKNTGTEPTYTAPSSGASGNIMKTFTVHPQLGYEYLAPLGQEDIIKGGGLFCVQLNAAAGVNVRGYIKVEE